MIWLMTFERVGQQNDRTGWAVGAAGGLPRQQQAAKLQVKCGTSNARLSSLHPGLVLKAESTSRAVTISEETENLL
jgi:hypothetical protein